MNTEQPQFIYQAEPRYLSDSEKEKPVIRVSDLIAHLQTLPPDWEIVLYPKYWDGDKFDYARMRLENVGEAHGAQHRYCRILF